MAGPASIVRNAYSRQFGDAGPVRTFRAPGRVNLIGEHTDYNLGFVLPIAMEEACFTAAGMGQEGLLRVYSLNMDERSEWPVEEVPHMRAAGHWTDYVIGVAQQILRLGLELRPLNLAIYSTVPLGSGLSSSAAIEMSSALALLYGRELERSELARLGQRAEREFVGLPCGIMDQYVSVFGEAGKAILLDCRSITHEAVSLPEGASIVAINSMVKHELGVSEYPVRVRECEASVEAIRKAYPAVHSLRDVTSDLLDRVQDSMPDIVYRRACHVVTENERVVRFVAASGRGDLHEMGRLFLASHRSLQHDYEVSSEELDFLVDTAADTTGVYGARMTGGGFGGCTVNLVAPDRLEAFREHVTAAYQRRYGIVPQMYECVPAQGAGEVSS